MISFFRETLQPFLFLEEEKRASKLVKILCFIRGRKKNRSFLESEGISNVHEASFLQGSACGTVRMGRAAQMPPPLQVCRFRDTVYIL